MFLNIAQDSVLSKLLPKASKGEEDNADGIESQGAAQAHPMMIQSENSMTDSGIKAKNMSSDKKSLATPTLQKKFDKSKPMQEQSMNMNGDDEDKNNKDDEEV